MMKHKKTNIKFLSFFTAVMLVVAVSLAGCGETDRNTNELGKKYGPIFESFTAEDIYGTVQDENLILDARYTLVLIWSTTCNPCIEGMPKMESLYQEYKDIGVTVLGIVVNLQDQQGNPVPETIADAVSIAEVKGVTFPNITIPAPVMDFLYSEIQYTPTAFFVDQSGTIVSDLVIGEQEYEYWSDAIEELIN
jgi:thiol-disulfide isomerase/thioredoxin